MIIENVWKYYKWTQWGGRWCDMNKNEHSSSYSFRNMVILPLWGDFLFYTLFAQKDHMVLCGNHQFIDIPSNNICLQMTLKIQTTLCLKENIQNMVFQISQFL